MSGFKIPAHVLDEVRRHAVETHEEWPGFESVGVLVVDDDDNVLRYTRLANPSRRAGHAGFDSRRLDRRSLRTVPIHSHPLTRAEPSAGDISDFRWPIAGIFSLVDERLTLWRTGERWTPLPFQIEA